MDGAAGVHPDPQPLAGLQPSRRQRLQRQQFLGQPHAPAGVTLREQLPQERLVLGPAGEVPAAAQEQGLLQGPLELVVALLDVAVLVRLPGVDRLPAQPVVPQQRLVAPLERLAVAAGGHRGRQAVGAVDHRHPAQLAQGILQSLTEALEALGETHHAGLPVRVGQHEVVHQVRERRAGQRDAYVGAVREVAGAQPTRLVDLGEEDLLGRPVQGPPLLDPPLQRPQLALGEAAGVLPLQPAEQGLDLQAGIEGQLRLHLGPDVGEGVGSGSPGTLHRSHLAGQLAEPAVLARGLLIDAGPGRRLPLGQALQVEAAQAAHLLIGDHPKPPCGKGFG
jgi:hypothetical protein